ncbi:hypothetical protein [Dactylosporangium vinaceum]|uniref:hypothetical protein n=1 Tax=Dactylosporangium vinaceum TaxID=53362 RepID=UPI0036D24AEF
MPQATGRPGPPPWFTDPGTGRLPPPTGPDPGRAGRPVALVGPNTGRLDLPAALLEPATGVDPPGRAAVRGWEAVTGLAAPAQRHAIDDLRVLLPADAAVRREVVREAVTWLAANLGDPRLVAARCAELGPAAAALGVPPQRLEALAILLVDALRANPPAPPLRADEEAALRDAGRLIARWAEAGVDAAGHEPVHWSATVTAHDRRRADMAVLTLRTYLPYPCPPGLRAVAGIAALPGRARECWVGNRPAVDGVVEVHVALHRDDPVGAELVERTRVGDRIDLYRPTGSPVPLDDDAPLLLIADRDAVGPIRAALTALRAARTATAGPATTPPDAAGPGTARPGRAEPTTARPGSAQASAATGPGHRAAGSGRDGSGADRRAPDVTVFWPAPVERDVYRLADLAPEGTVVIRDRFADDGRDWSGHAVFVAGTTAANTAVTARLRAAGVAPERLVVAGIG